MQETPAEPEMVRMLETGEVDAFGQNRERTEAVAAKYLKVRHAGQFLRCWTIDRRRKGR